MEAALQSTVFLDCNMFKASNPSTLTYGMHLLFINRILTEYYQMLQSNWLNSFSNSRSVSVQWMEVVYVRTTFSGFSNVSKKM